MVRRWVACLGSMAAALPAMAQPPARPVFRAIIPTYPAGDTAQFIHTLKQQQPVDELTTLLVQAQPQLFSDPLVVIINNAMALLKIEQAQATEQPLFTPATTPELQSLYTKQVKAMVDAATTLNLNNGQTANLIFLNGIAAECQTGAESLAGFHFIGNIYASRAIEGLPKLNFTPQHFTPAEWITTGEENAVWQRQFLGFHECGHVQQTLLTAKQAKKLPPLQNLQKYLPGNVDEAFADIYAAYFLLKLSADRDDFAARLDYLQGIAAQRAQAVLMIRAQYPQLVSHDTAFMMDNMLRSLKNDGKNYARIKQYSEADICQKAFVNLVQADEILHKNVNGSDELTQTKTVNVFLQRYLRATAQRLQSRIALASDTEKFCARLSHIQQNFTIDGALAAQRYQITLKDLNHVRGQIAPELRLQPAYQAGVELWENHSSVDYP